MDHEGLLYSILQSPPSENVHVRVAVMPVVGNVTDVSLGLPLTDSVMYAPPVAVP